MADSRLVDEWLKKAEEDLGFASSVVEDSSFYAQICFHFHQAAEKFLKAFIVDQDLEFQKIHDLLVLLKSCSAVNSSLDDILDDCMFLNRFYIETRYPVHWPTKFTKEEALKAQKSCMEIQKAIMKALSADAKTVSLNSFPQPQTPRT